MLSGVNLSLEIVDLSNPQVLPNGQYSDFINSRATAIVHEYLNNYGIAKYDTNPAAESFFRCAFDDVLAEMEVDLKIITPAVFKELISEYIIIAQNFNNQIRVLTPGTPEYDLRLEQANLAVLIVQEAAANSVIVPPPENEILLEFIYRFANTGERYGLAFKSLYTSLADESFCVIYDIFVKYFDQDRSALPVLYVQINDPSLLVVRDHFINFITGLYEKVIRINLRISRESFDKHACMLISSMISCNIIDEFIPMLTELLKSIDIFRLFSSPRFAKSAIDMSKKFKRESPAILDIFASALIDDNVILAIESSKFIDLGSILFNFKVNQNELYQKYFRDLSIEAQEILKEIEMAFITYSRALFEIVSIEKLENDFGTMEEDAVNRLVESVKRMLPVFPDFFNHQPNEAGNFVTKLVAMIPKLVNIAMRQSTRDLDVFRFRLFVKLLELTFYGPVVLENTTDAFASVLGFYTSRFHVSSRFNPIDKETQVTVISLLDKLVKANRFFKSPRYRNNFYNFLKMTVPERADSIILEYLYEVLVLAEKKYNTCFDIVNTAKIINLSVQQLLSRFISESIQAYLDTISSTPIYIDQYLGGDLVNIAKLAIAEKALALSEVVLVKAIFNNFASVPVFNE